MQPAMARSHRCLSLAQLPSLSAGAPLVCEAAKQDAEEEERGKHLAREGLRRRRRSSAGWHKTRPLDLSSQPGTQPDIGAACAARGRPSRASTCAMVLSGGTAWMPDMAAVCSSPAHAAGVEERMIRSWPCGWVGPPRHRP